ncbi:hypothetical protein ACFWCB_06525 [Streptomyces sp. NPDC060048]
MNQDLADELHRRADADRAARQRWQQTRETHVVLSSSISGMLPTLPVAR